MRVRSTCGRTSEVEECRPGAAISARPVSSALCSLRWRVLAAAPTTPERRLLPRLRLGGIALGLGHFQEALALAGVHPLAGIVGGLAGRLALAGVDPRTLHL